MMERTTDGAECHILIALVFDQKVNLVTFAVDYLYEDMSEGRVRRIFLGDVRPKGLCSGNDASTRISGSIDSSGAESIVRLS